MARISKAQLIKLQKKLKTDAAIGEQFGITRQAVHLLRKKFDIRVVTCGQSSAQRRHCQRIRCAAVRHSPGEEVRFVYFRRLNVSSMSPKKKVKKAPKAKAAKKSVRKRRLQRKWRKRRSMWQKKRRQ
jgi:hypothetical protein